MSIVTWIIILPLAAALGLCAVPRSFKVVIRGVALAATFAAALLAVLMFLQFRTGAAGYQFEQKVQWIKELGISYHVGIDGLNLGLEVMAAIVAFAACCLSWEIQKREKEFYILLLVMAGGIIGAFASLDLFMFYFLHELALVPTFIMIGVWGRGPEKNYATFQITLYLSLGALIALIGLVTLYISLGVNSFDLPDLIARARAGHLPLKTQHLVFPLLLFGFGILVSLWPFHTWAPLGYGSAPTPTAMLHAGVLKKFGVYGLLRVALPLLPNAAAYWMHIAAWLALGNLLYAGWVAMAQKDFNRLIGYSSVAHMGFIFLGLASLNVIGITGAVLVMVAHGFLAALSFGLAGYIYRQTGTLEMEELGGLLRRLPFIGTCLVMAGFAACGLPGFGNFAGEVTVLFGAWQAFPRFAVLACWAALIIGAVYMLRAIRTILHGPLPEKWSNVTDAPHAWRKAPFVLLLVCLLVLGFFPRLLTDKVRGGAAEALGFYPTVPLNARAPEKAPVPVTLTLSHRQTANQ